MSNVTPFESKDAIQEQASLWISRIDRGLTSQEKQELVTWGNLSEQHKASLLELATLWDDLSALNELSGLFPLRTKEPQQRYLFAEKTRWAVAASLVLCMLFSVSWVMNTMQIQSTDGTSMTYTADAKTSIGQQKPVSLPDGSVIHLNTDSRVAVEYTQSARRISLLKGEAHFDVAHDTSRPFIVEAGNNTVTAVGTAFNVQLMNNNSFELLVTEGKVLVKDLLDAMTPTISMTPQAQPLQGKGVYMTSGEKARFSGEQRGFSTLSLDQVQKDLAWQQGMVVFQGETLTDALKEVSRYTAVTFDIKDDVIKQRRVAGYFKTDDINGLLSALQNSFNIRHQQIGDKHFELTAQ